MDKDRLTQIVKNLVMSSGAIAVGIATRETLQGGPVSTDLTYVLPEAGNSLVYLDSADIAHWESA